jgi:hypothetical protein
MRAFHSHLIAFLLGGPALAACGKAAVEPWPVAPPIAVGEQPSAPLEDLARRALADPSLADELRAAGPLGLQALLTQADAAGRLDAALDPLIDRVASQRYARHSGLYWYTDLEQAIERAEAEHKPILSLRLLGDLRDDLSCANSRYFRVVLYPDPVLRSYLQRAFVLHWSSERPAPKITVDYGDGRKLVRTITGNSVHYVLDSQGRTVDAIPGLMGARSFQAELEQAWSLAREAETDSDENFAKRLRARHAQGELDLLERWKREFAAVGVTIDNQDPRALNAQNARLSAALASMPELPISALEAAEMAPTKAVPERRLLEQLTPKTTFLPADARRKSTRAVWARIAERHLSEVELSEPSIVLMHELAPRGFDIDGHAVPMDGPGFAALLERFTKVLALDTVENRLELRVGIHERLAAHPLAPFDELNHWVYSSVFLTPRSDPWLGLTADHGFTALPKDGIRQAAE